MDVTVDLKKEGPEFLLKLEYMCKLCFLKADPKKQSHTINRVNWRQAFCNYRFDSSTNNVMEVLRGCLVSHRYWDAAPMLENISLRLSVRTYGIYTKNSLYVLENLKQSASRDITEFFVRNVKILKEVNKNELVLEYLMSRLRNHQFDFPTELVQSIVTDKLTVRKNPLMDPIFESYVTLFDYIRWAKVATSLSNSQFVEGYQDKSEKIINSWSKVIVKPGIWDIFLEKLVQVLLSKSNYRQCDEILKSYAETHPEHLNAYVYLELYRNEINRKERKNNLKKIAEMSPSDPLVIDYVDTLLQDEELAEAIKCMFLFLDYSVNKENFRGWSTLIDVLCLTLQSQVHKPLLALKNNWKERCSYWIQYHFDVDYVDFENRHQSRLCVQKSIFLCIVLKSTEHPFIQRTLQNLVSSYPKRLKKLERKMEIIQSLNKKILL